MSPTFQRETRFENSFKITMNNNFNKQYKNYLILKYRRVDAFIYSIPMFVVVIISMKLQRQIDNYGYNSLRRVNIFPCNEKIILWQNDWK